MGFYGTWPPLLGRGHTLAHLKAYASVITQASTKASRAPPVRSTAHPHHEGHVERRRAAWVTAAAVIDTYRERYQIDDAHIAFGSQPAEGEQRTERERAVAYTRELLQQIDRAEPDRSIAGAGRDQPPGPELVR